MVYNEIPEFAVVGHPNEGKSSVVSTLTEDDSVRISPTPGETTECRTFPVMIDNTEIIRFTDTPGFQNPGKIVAWMRNYNGEDGELIKDFRREHSQKTEFFGDCQLFEPIERGAGIIYVVDGSRPLRKIDQTEMEILRLTGRPRMAIINCKDDSEAYLEKWKSEFRKHFNAVRVFNSNRATYAERISLLESLKGIDQDWQSSIEKVISAFKHDWGHRVKSTVVIILQMLEDCLTLKISQNFTDKKDEIFLKNKLQEKYAGSIERTENRAHEEIRKLHKHNIFNYNLPAHSILKENLFSETTWQFLGLTSKQLITAAGLAGGAIGAVLDIAAAGLTFGIFSAIGGAFGAGWAALGGGKQLSKTKISGFSLGGQHISIGPNEDPQFVYILLDRSLIFYSHIINWAHGRRDYQASRNIDNGRKSKKGFTSYWDANDKIKCSRYSRAVIRGNDEKKEIFKEELRNLLEDKLRAISQSESAYGML